MRSDSQFPTREPIVHTLVTLGLSYPKIATAIGCSDMTIKNDVNDRMGGLKTIAPDRPTKKASIYRACFIIWSETGELDPMVRKALETELGIDRLTNIALGMTMGYEALTVPAYPREFEAYAKVLWYLTNDMLTEPNSHLMEQYKREVLMDNLPVPQSFEQFRAGLFESIRCLADRNYLTACFPEYVSEVCEQAMQELKNESPREAEFVRRLHGIGCAKETLNQIGGPMGISRERVRQAEIKGLREFRRKVTIALRGKNDGYTTMEIQLSRCDDLQEDLSRAHEELSTAHAMLRDLNAKREALTSLVNEHGSADLTRLIDELDVTEESDPTDLMKRVDELELSVRAANCLQNAGIEYVYQLVERTESELLRTKNFGRKSIREIKERLAEFDPPLKFSTKIPSEMRAQLPG